MIEPLPHVQMDVYNACIAIGEDYEPMPDSRDRYEVALKRVISHLLAPRYSSKETAAGLRLRSHVCVLRYWSQTDAANPCACMSCDECMLRLAYEHNRIGQRATVRLRGERFLSLHEALCERGKRGAA